MTQSWRTTLEKLGISTSSTSAPPGEEGDWELLFAVFGTSGFLRFLTDGASLFLQIAPPRGVDDVDAVLENAGWSVVTDVVPVAARRSFPEDDEALRELWITVNYWGAAIDDDDAEQFRAAVARRAEARDDETEQSAEPSASAGSPFEPIGADERPTLPVGAFGYALEIEQEWLDVVVGVSAVLEPPEFEALERTLIRNLRAKFDVAVEPVAAHEVQAQLPARPETKLGLRVRPDAVVGAIDLAGARRAVEGYLANIETLASSGIDPLIFLGVRSAGQLGVSEKSPELEPIGEDEPAGRTALLVEDDKPSRPAMEATNVVLSVPYEPEEGAPLEPGRFEDPRLRGQDATTALVDVVLRHPGFSDRRIGQVLSILLSEGYANCLDLAERAPIVIARGVARERAQTMKTVIEGAGGRVFLSEPDRFREQ